MPEETRVIFRKYKTSPHEIIAFFPDHLASYGRISCYQHIGQHGEGDSLFSAYTKPATPEEYADLKRELIRIGYDNLKIMKRVNHADLVKNWKR